MPSEIVGYLILAMIMLFASIEALRLLGFASVTELVTSFTAFAGQVIPGLIIFAIGLYLSNLAAKTIKASGAAQAGMLALAARVSILALSGAMALRQMGLANEIINLAFGLLLGAVAAAASGEGTQKQKQGSITCRLAIGHCMRQHPQTKGECCENNIWSNLYPEALRAGDPGNAGQVQPIQDARLGISDPDRPCRPGP